VSEQLALLPERLTAHLQLTLVALAFGMAIAIPLGIAVTRRRSLEGGVLGVASVIQTIPSLALLAIMVPTLATLAVWLEGVGIELRSIGYPPAIVALSLYSILRVLRNTVAGISGVDPALVEAARGVGMTPRQQLVRVELPLALPVVVAGVRTAAVWVVGTATLSTPVGATSLGNFIFSGLQTRNFMAVWVGCLAAAGLALLLDGLIAALESGVRRRSRSRVGAALVLVFALYAYVAFAFVADATRTGDRPVLIGSKTFTEQYILSELVAGWVREETGRDSRALESLGSTVAFDALRESQIDLYIDYSGTIWATVMKRQGLPESREAVLQEVGEWLAAEHGITLVAALGFENTYALGMRADRARELGVSRIGDLARVAANLEIGGDLEFFSRAEWKALETRYGLSFSKERSMDPGLMYQAVANGEVDVISAFSTDGRIAAYDLVLLQDDLGVIPPYDAILLASPRLAQEAPGVIDALRALEGMIDEPRMQGLNYSVDEDGEGPAAVAGKLLREIRGSRE